MRSPLTAAFVLFSHSLPVIRLKPETSPPTSTPSTASPSNSPRSNASPVELPPPTAEQPVTASPDQLDTDNAALPSTTTTTTATMPPQAKSVDAQLEDFFNQDWTQKPGTTAEILFIKRATRSTESVVFSLLRFPLFLSLPRSQTLRWRRVILPNPSNPTYPTLTPLVMLAQQMERSRRFPRW